MRSTARRIAAVALVVAAVAALGACNRNSDDRDAEKLAAQTPDGFEAVSRFKVGSTAGSSGDSTYYAVLRPAGPDSGMDDLKRFYEQRGYESTGTSPDGYELLTGRFLVSAAPLESAVSSAGTLPDEQAFVNEVRRRVPGSTQGLFVVAVAAS
jgi:hypothetical protein